MLPFLQGFAISFQDWRMQPAPLPEIDHLFVEGFGQEVDYFQEHKNHAYCCREFCLHRLLSWRFPVE
jgi:hypothetical protein